MGRPRRFLSALALALAAAPAACVTIRGSDVHCIGGRAHMLSYNVEGEPNNADINSGGSGLDSARIVVVMLEPAPEAAASCGLGTNTSQLAGGKAFCVGANQDAACKAAKAGLPIGEGLSCSGCFLGATADIYYKLNYSARQLNSVEVGLRDMHVRGGLGLTVNKSAALEPLSGSSAMGGEDRLTLIDTLVGCPVCIRVKISVATPTRALYSMVAHGHLEATLGVDLDVNLGDSVVRWDRESGWTRPETPKTLTVSPVLVASGSVTAHLALGLNASLQIDVDDIIWYHLDLLPSAPMECTAHASLPPFRTAEVCLDGKLTFELQHEADLHWNLLNLKTEYRHWGPILDFEWENKQAVHACEQIAEFEEKPFSRRPDFFT